MQQILAEQKYTTEIVHTTNRNKNTTSNPQTWACSPNRYEKKQITSDNNKLAVDNVKSSSGSKDKHNSSVNSNSSHQSKFEEAINNQLNGSANGSEKGVGDENTNNNIVKTKWELANAPESNKMVMTSQGPIKIQPNHLIPVNTNRQDAAKAYRE